MRMPKRGEKGFTLIELLIVVAILGVLAAIVIPNVGRFIGRGESEAMDTEYTNIQNAVISMKTDNKLTTLPNPISLATNRTQNMGAYPDATSDWQASPGGKDTDIYGVDYAAGDKAGYILYQHDINGGGAQTNLVNYVATANTTYWYTCDSAGTITQYDTAP